MDTQPTLLELLGAYEAEHAFMRKLVLPRDDSRCVTQWYAGYRWFSDPKGHSHREDPPGERSAS